MNISNKEVENTKQNEKPLDYSKMSNDELLNQFKTENWNKLDTEEKQISLLQEVENRNAAANGRKPATVKALKQEEDPAIQGSVVMGKYNIKDNTIEIKMDENPYENLDSVVHEGQHANHFYSTTNQSQLTVSQQSLINSEFYPSKNGQDSHYAYYQKANDQDLYRIYSSELNTNNTAFGFLANQKDRYGDDANYVAYLKERNEYYNKVADDLSTLSEAKKSAYLETAKANYESGKFTKEQYNSLKNTIENGGDGFDQQALSYHKALNNMVVDENENKLVSLNIDNEESTQSNTTEDKNNIDNKTSNNKDLVMDHEDLLTDEEDSAQLLDDSDENVNELDSDEESEL